VQSRLFSQLNEFIDRGEIITTDGYLKHCQESGRAAYIKRDFLFRDGLWRGEVQRSLLGKHLDGSRQSKIVIGHSDIPTKVSDQLLAATFGVQKIFGINLRPFGSLSSSLPLGLTNYCDDSDLHREIGDLNNLIEADKTSEYCQSFSPTYFASFNVNTNTQVRSQVLDILGKLQKPNRVIFSEIGYNKNMLIPYLRNLRQIPFVICPEGNGVDTHRLWETLYMGGVPVVKKNDYLNLILRDLPVIVLSSWNKLNDLNFMHDSWVKIQESEWDFNNIGLSYWTKLIDSK